MNAASVLGIGLVFTLKDEVSNTASKMTQKFKQLDYVSSETAAKMESSLKGIGTGFKMMGAGAALLAPLGLAVKESMALNKQISAVGAKTGLQGAAHAQAIEQLKANAKELGATRAYTAVQVGQAQEFLAMAGFKTNQIIGAMPGLLDLAAASGTDLATTADIVSDTLTAMGMSAEQTNYLASQMAFVATSANTSVVQLGEGLKYVTATASGLGIASGEMLALSGMLGDIGLKGSVAGTSMENFLSHLGNIKKGKMSDAFAKLGLDMSDVVDKNGNLKTLSEIIPKLQQGLKGMGNTQAMAVLEDLFGKIGKKTVNAFLDNSNKTVGEAMKKDFVKYASDVTNVSEDYAKNMAEKMLDNLAGDFTKLQSAVSGMLISIGDKIEPFVRPIVQAFSSLASYMTSIADSRFGTFIIGLTGALGAGLVALGGFVSAFHTVKFAMMAIQPVLVMLKGAFASTLVPLLPFIAVGVAVAGVIYGLVKAYQSFTNVLEGNAAPATGFLGFMQKVGGAIHAVIAIWKSATSEGFTLSGKLYEALNSIGLGEFALNIGTWIVRIKAFFGGAAERFENLKNVFGSVGEAFGRIGTAFSPIIDLLAKAGFTIDKLGGDVSIFSQLGGYAFDALTLGIRGIAVALEITANYVTLALEGFMIFYNFVTNTFSQINGYIEQFKGGFISLPQLFLKIGNAITTNLLEGIKAGWSSITSFLVNSLKALPGGEAVAAYFGIGGDTAEGQAKQAAVAQTGLAGSGVSDTEVAPSQASSSFSKKVGNINNASVTKAQQTRETSEGIKQLGQAGMANAGGQNTQVNLQPKFNVQIGDRDVAAVIREMNELDDARS
ncbi:phage tail tape measure protein [Bernardetia sp. OM2101]|uniref:phage tail tape measure protein n=1 Tax=Bernardetia sp. OM2101 TaxID=3344876 RepID=UPI0035CF8A8A